MCAPWSTRWRLEAKRIASDGALVHDGAAEAAEERAPVTDGGSRHPIRPGDVVADKYRVDRVLGEGGMGIVVAATHEHLDQRVALKFLLPAMAANPEIVQRFVREARAAVRIHSEHVARVLDVGTYDGSPFMVMEYLEGGDLAQVLAERGELPVGDAVGYLLEACEAIAEAHSLGIVHRDLKPANLYLARRSGGKPSVKVLDFGISKAPATGTEANLTRTSALMGSPSYMSPEQLVSAASVDFRADIWALGVVLYEMLTRQLPFTAQSMPELVGTILQQTPAPIVSLRQGVPVGLQSVVDRCLQKDPAQRFANIAELARALLPFGPSRSEDSVERIEHVLGVGRGPAPFAASPPVQASPAGSTFSPATSQAQTAASRKLLVSGLLAGLGVMGFAVGALVVLRGARPAGALAGSASAVAAEAAATVPPLPLPSSVSTPAPSTVLAPEATGQPLAAPSEVPAPSSVPRPVPNATKVGPRPALVPTLVPPAPSTSAAPACRTVSYFDTEGNKHFKQECR
jgi:serine/threonine-protein kinase